MELIALWIILGLVLGVIVLTILYLSWQLSHGRVDLAPADSRREPSPVSDDPLRV